jgi:solute carrier family 25 protein 33/36
LRHRKRRSCLFLASIQPLCAFYRDIQKFEGVPALFRGLVPTLVGVIPARSINFFTYGNGKQVIANQFNDGVETATVHLSAAAFAGIVTSTCTNPIWVVKTRMQLSAAQSRPFSSSWECIRTIFHDSGVRGFYKGLSASYLGVSEGIIQWTLYEQLKKTAKKAEGGPLEWTGMLVAAGGAKMIASLITYPHEVCLQVSPIQVPSCLVFRWSVPGYDNPTSTGSSNTDHLSKHSAS